MKNPHKKIEYDLRIQLINRDDGKIYREVRHSLDQINKAINLFEAIKEIMSYVKL
jgi:hypothetical protein